MNVYDFDNTILRGDSTALFYRYCLFRTPAMIRLLPGLLFSALFVLPKDTQAFKARMFAFLRTLDDAQSMVEAFWADAQKRVKPFYLKNRRADDVIISASPEFLLAPICEKLGVTRLIASKVDIRTGAFTGKNCRGEEKVLLFRERFGGAQIENFYSDSHADDPLAKISRRAYLIKGDRLLPWR